VARCQLQGVRLSLEMADATLEIVQQAHVRFHWPMTPRTGSQVRVPQAIGLAPFCHQDLGSNTKSHRLRVMLQLPFRLR